MWHSDKIAMPLSMTNKKERLFKPKRVQASTGS
nr:MAG TPA: hypothetical protein [Caudoviricetes sp.]